ncbi:MAG: hypothetical protein IJ086_14080 [Clostridium sp.]|nr:hypothetical protein [Clostridium sp.]
MAINNKSKKIKKANSKEQIRMSILEQIRSPKYRYNDELKLKILNETYIKYNLIFPFDVDFLIYAELPYDEYIEHLIEQNQNKISNDKILFLKKLYNEYKKTDKSHYGEERINKLLYKDEEGKVI